jgi:signal transduction histidine kinase
MAMPDPIADFDLFDRATAPHLQDLAQLAAHTCDVPMAAVNGLGLATCRRIVEAHGGEIDLEPAPGGGTVAWFTIPDPHGDPEPA